MHSLQTEYAKQMVEHEESSDIVAVTENDIDSIAESLGLMGMTADKVEDFLGTFFKGMH